MRNVELLYPRALRDDSTEPKSVDYRVTVPRDVASIDAGTQALLLHRGKRAAAARAFLERSTLIPFVWSPVPDKLEPVTIVILAREIGPSNKAVSEIRVLPVLEKRINCADYVQVNRTRERDGGSF